MNSALLVSLLVVGNFTVATAVFAFVVQSSERSLYRYRMWRLRDEVVDAVLTGQLTADKAVLHWLDMTEAFIDITDYLTPYRYLALSRTYRRAGLDVHAESDADIGTSPETRAFLDRMSRSARAARMRLFFLGSPSGWLVSLAAPLLARTVTRGEDPHGARETEPSEGTTAPFQGRIVIVRPSSAEAVRRWSTERFGSPATLYSRLQPRDCDEPAYA